MLLILLRMDSLRVIEIMNVCHMNSLAILVVIVLAVQAIVYSH